VEVFQRKRCRVCVLRQCPMMQRSTHARTHATSVCCSESTRKRGGKRPSFAQEQEAVARRRASHRVLPNKDEKAIQKRKTALAVHSATLCDTHGVLWYYSVEVNVVAM
jgi:hypothetical protein